MALFVTLSTSIHSVSNYSKKTGIRYAKQGIELIVFFAGKPKHKI